MADPRKQIASMNPEEFSSGMPDNFVATIARSRYKAWKSPNSRSGKYMLFGAWDLVPDDDSGIEPFTEHYLAGFLNSSYPTNDGPDIEENEREPAGADADFYKQLAEGAAEIPEGKEEEFEGLYVMGQAPSKRLGWAQALRELSTLGFKDWSHNSTCVEGLKCHFNRVSQENQPKAQPGEEARNYQVLVPTKLFADEKGKGKAAASSKASGKTSTSASTSAASKESAKTNGSDVSTQVEEIILGALANNSPLTRKQITKPVVSAFKGSAMAEANALLNNKGWLGADERPWEYDPEKETLSQL